MTKTKGKTMGRHKNSTEKEWSELNFSRQYLRATMDTKAIAAIKEGVYDIAQNMRIALVDIPENNPDGISPELQRIQNQKIERAQKELLELMSEAVITKNGNKLRKLADSVERTGPFQPHDPLRTELLDLKTIGQGRATMTAKQVQQKLEKQGHKYSEKSVRRVAEELKSPLLEGKRGSPKGKRKSPIHRAN
jgi:hypothetical protein